jgi:predicted outer membrane repeat protein
MDNVCPCSEAGIRAAIEAGGEDPYTFDCNGPQTVTTLAEIEIDNDVILDGEGNLTVDGDEAHRVFLVLEGVTTELRGFIVTRGFRIDDNPMSPDENGGGIANRGTLTIASSTVSGNRANGAGGGIANVGTLTVTDSTISGNYSSQSGGGIEGGTVSLTNSTVSGNTAENKGGGFSSGGSIVLVSSTVVDNTSPFISGIVTFNEGTLTATSTIIEGDCATEKVVTSNAYNIESPGDTCGFDQPTDQVNVSADDLEFGPLQDNGGPTETHALGEDSVAIDHIPAVDCEVDEDQRGIERPQGDACDVGAFELEVAP